ncbi:hypothetical protein BDC45DRAFT_541330 [Circinella umbellata]|nr:hypothetical protein BDC45DRAFT_541330 [Circinella umbellata]
MGVSPFAIKKRLQYIITLTHYFSNVACSPASRLMCEMLYSLRIRLTTRISMVSEVNNGYPVRCIVRPWTVTVLETLALNDDTAGGRFLSHEELKRRCPLIVMYVLFKQDICGIISAHDYDDLFVVRMRDWTDKEIHVTYKKRFMELMGKHVRF